jgi:predicted nucleic acid-binding protein
MIVVDASVLANMLVYADDRGRRARAVLARDTQWAAPEHWMIEVFSVLRGLRLGGKITAGIAVRSIDRLAQLGVDHVPVAPLLPYMWDCRNVTLVTADARLARTATRHCAVELAA